MQVNIVKSASAQVTFHTKLKRNAVKVLETSGIICIMFEFLIVCVCVSKRE